MKNPLLLALTFGVLLMMPWSVRFHTSAMIRALEEAVARRSAELAELRSNKPENAMAQASGKTLNPEQFSELLRLRSEVAQFKRDQKLAHEIEELTEDKPLGTITRENYVETGFASPASAFQTFISAFASGNRNTYLNSLSPRLRKSMEESLEDVPEGRMPGAWKNSTQYRATGFRILEQRRDEEGNRLLKIFLEGEDTVEYEQLRKIEGEWKVDGGSSREEFLKAAPITDLQNVE